MSKTESKVQKQGKNLGDTMNAATRITMNANSILQQPDIKLDELKSLPEHQKSTNAKLTYTSKHGDLTVLQTNLDAAKTKVHALQIALITVAAAEGACPLDSYGCCSSGH